MAAVLRSHWKSVLAGGLTMSAPAMIGYIMIAYLLSYGVTQLGVSRP